MNIYYSLEYFAIFCSYMHLQLRIECTKLLSLQNLEEFSNCVMLT